MKATTGMGVVPTSDALFFAIRRMIRGAGEGRAMSFSIPLPPVPASRPRVTKWGAHYTKTYAVFKKQATALLKDKHGPHFDGPLIVLTELVAKRPQRLTRQMPIGDNDNYEKAVWDAITQSSACWEDDDQIVLNITLKRYAERGEDPRVDVWVKEL
jgi:Holliday junction resolvase RusA-like endonuclease